MGLINNPHSSLISVFVSTRPRAGAQEMSSHYFCLILIISAAIAFLSAFLVATASVYAMYTYWYLKYGRFNLDNAVADYPRVLLIVPFLREYIERTSFVPPGPRRTAMRLESARLKTQFGLAISRMLYVVLLGTIAGFAGLLVLFDAFGHASAPVQ
jgi:hypothetical protein